MWIRNLNPGRAVWPRVWIVFIGIQTVGAALVQTRAGRIWIGEVHLIPPATVQLTLADQRVMRIALTNLARLSFRPGSAATNPDSMAGSSPVPLGKAGLPQPWQSGDIGDMKVPGRARWQQGTFQLEAYRGKTSGPQPACLFVYQAFRGDCEIAARVRQLTGYGTRRRSRRPTAGVMMRTGLSPTAPGVLLGLRPKGTCVFQSLDAKPRRPLERDTAGLTLPYWVKLKRVGNVLTAFLSREGRVWELMQRKDAALPEVMLVGLALINRDPVGPCQARLDAVRVRAAESKTPFVPQIILRNGTVIADRFLAVDEFRVHFSNPRKELAVPTRDVARLILRPSVALQKTATDRPGALMQSGDFLEGEFQGLTGGRLRLSSVLYGLRNFDAKEEVIAIYLRPAIDAPCAWRITTRDGSDLRATTLFLAQDTLDLNVPLAGTLRIPQVELREIRRGR